MSQNIRALSPLPPPSTRVRRRSGAGSARTTRAARQAGSQITGRRGRRPGPMNGALREDGHMRTLRIALAQVASPVGDIPGNAATIRAWSRRAAEAGEHLVAFPEMMLTGYPLADLE